MRRDISAFVVVLALIGFATIGGLWLTSAARWRAKEEAGVRERADLVSKVQRLHNNSDELRRDLTALHEENARLKSEVLILKRSFPDYSRK